jgi:hypothetical protein
MSRTNLAYIVAILLTLYMVGGVSYVWYQAYKIAKTAVGVEHRVSFFFRMLYNPFWMILERNNLGPQTPEFKAHISKVEIHKYLIIAGGIFILVSGSFLVRSVAP